MSGGRRAFYKLADPFLAMWYVCVRPNLSGLNLEARTALLHAREAWRHHVAALWEGLCRQQWPRIGYRDMEWEPAGRYWVSRATTGAEWDVVSVSADRRQVFLGECKWMRDATHAKAIAAIRKIIQRPIPPLKGQPQVRLGLFLPERGNLPPEIEGVDILDARMMLARRD